MITLNIVIGKAVVADCDNSIVSSLGAICANACPELPMINGVSDVPDLLFGIQIANAARDADGFKCVSPSCDNLIVPFGEATCVNTCHDLPTIHGTCDVPDMQSGLQRVMIHSDANGKMSVAPSCAKLSIQNICNEQNFIVDNPPPPPPPTTSDAGADQIGGETCGLLEVSLSANIPIIGIGEWSIVSGVGGSIDSPYSPNTLFSGVAGESYTLRWTITHSPFPPSTDDVVVTFNQNPTTASAGADQTITGLIPVLLSANTPIIGTGEWSVSGPSTNPAQFSDINDPSATFTPDEVGDYTLTWTITNPPCGISGDSISLSVEPVITSFVISGKIIWEGNRLSLMSGVAGATVTLSGPETGSMVTGLDGLYSFTVNTPGDYSVSVVKNSIPNALNGVSSADASRLQQHIIGSLPLTDPYKLIAGDVNSTNSISAADLNAIQQAIIGNPIILSLFQNKTWIFVPQAYSFPNPLAPWNAPSSIILTGISTDQINQNFIAAKLGDVNSTANPTI